MAQAVRKNYAYDYNSFNGAYVDTDANRRKERNLSTHKKVQKSSQNLSKIHPAYINIGAFALGILLFVFLMFAVATIISTQTSITMANAQSVQNEINEAKYAGEQLELEHARLSSLNRIQTESTKLGMQPAGTPVYITLPEIGKRATTATFADGTISLSDTINNIVNSQYTK